MDLLSSQVFWPIRDGLPATFEPLSSSTECDVVIVGAGVTGAFLAWYLREAGLETVVLDQRQVAHGSTAGCTGLLQYELDVPLHQLEKKMDPKAAARSVHRCRTALKTIAKLVRKLDIDCGFHARKSVLLASEPDHEFRLRREFNARQAAGFDVTWWTRRQLAHESSLPHAAAVVSDAGGEIDCYLLTYGLLAAAQRRSARIHERTRVSRVRHRPSGVEVWTSEGVRVRARHVVYATGYEVDATLPRPMTTLNSTFALASEPLSDFQGWPANRAIIWETARPYVYLRTTEDNRVIIGGYDEPFRDPRRRDQLLPAKTRALKRRFGQFFPKTSLEVAYSWAGTFAETPDGLPLIGRHPDRRGAWYALGYGGNGITFSLIAAEIIRDEILGHPDPDAVLFDFNRPSLE